MIDGVAAELKLSSAKGGLSISRELDAGVGARDCWLEGAGVSGLVANAVEREARDELLTDRTSAGAGTGRDSDKPRLVPNH